MPIKDEALKILEDAKLSSENFVKMTRQQFGSLPAHPDCYSRRNKPGKKDAPLVSVGHRMIQVTYVCQHGEHEITRCLQCEEES